MAYKLAKKVITNGGYVKEEMMNNLDVLLLNTRIDSIQYAELVGMMETPA